MSASSSRVGNAASAFVRGVGDVAAWSGLALVLVVAGNVLARYALSLGSVALQEAEWHLMAIGALFGMSYGLARGGEVRVDVLYGRLPPRPRAAIDLVGAIALGVVALVIAWLCVPYVEASRSIAEGSPDPGGLPLRWLLKATMPVAFVLLAVQALAMTIDAADRLRTGADPDTDPPVSA